MVFMEGCYLISPDGTGYFSSEKLFSPSRLVKICSRSGKMIYYLQQLGAAMVHPDSRTVILLPPEPICKQDGRTNKDCERNGARRWLGKFRKDHPHLKAVISGISGMPNSRANALLNWSNRNAHGSWVDGLYIHGSRRHPGITQMCGSGGFECPRLCKTGSTIHPPGRSCAQRTAPRGYPGKTHWLRPRFVCSSNRNSASPYRRSS
jgi:hypothetical protein